MNPLVFADKSVPAFFQLGPRDLNFTLLLRLVALVFQSKSRSLSILGHLAGPANFELGVYSKSQSTFLLRHHAFRPLLGSSARRWVFDFG